MSTVLRAQLWGAVAAGLAMGCKSESPPAAPVAADTSLPALGPSAEPFAADAAAETERAPSETRPDQPPHDGDDDPPATADGCGAGSKHATHTLHAGKAPPKQVPNPRIRYDANGCASASDVTDSCTGIRVLSGPARKGELCVYEICKGQVAPCGRLLLDAAGRARVAGVGAGSDWTGTRRSVLPAEARAGWRVDGQLEHASVAAFARFALELMAVGAPASLVEAAHRAALDEIEHARLCFALASDATDAVGPRALPLDAILLRQQIPEVVRAAMEECCCGETFAALVAQRALSGATHPEARAALERISVDEARHAELGWRFVAWAVAHYGVSARTAAADGLRVGLRRLTELAPRGEAGLQAYGRLSPGDLRAVAVEAAAMIRQLGNSLDLQLG